MNNLADKFFESIKGKKVGFIGIGTSNLPLIKLFSDKGAVVSAYDKFDYAKEAINLGVEQYLTKPISKSKIISVVEEATAKVDKVRDQRSNLLKIQEKLETVIPVVESGYVNSLLFQKEMAAAGYYQQLLDIEYGQGYVMVVQFGQSYENGRLVSPVGMNVKAQSFYRNSGMW